jgi:hypothetical protein
LSGGGSLGQFNNGLVGLGNTNLLFSSVEFNVTVVGKVGGNATVGTVCSSATLNSEVSGSVGDNALGEIESLGLAVSLEVEEEFADSFDRLFGPSTGLGSENLALGVSRDGVLVERNNLLVFKNVVHVFDCLVNQKSLAGTGGVVSVLEMSSKVSNLCFSGCRMLNEWARTYI